MKLDNALKEIAKCDLLEIIYERNKKILNKRLIIKDFDICDDYYDLKDFVSYETEMLCHINAKHRDDYLLLVHLNGKEN